MILDVVAWRACGRVIGNKEPTKHGLTLDYFLNYRRHFTHLTLIIPTHMREGKVISLSVVVQSQKNCLISASRYLSNS